MRFFILRAVVDDPVDHIQVIFHRHLRIAKRIFRRNEIRQLLKTEAVCVIAGQSSILLQGNHITDAQAVPMKVSRMAA